MNPVSWLEKITKPEDLKGIFPNVTIRQQRRLLVHREFSVYRIGH